MSSNLYYSGEFQKLSFGDKGLRVLANGSTSVSGEKFCAIQAIESSTISCTINTSGGDASLTSLEIGAGTVIYGNFSIVSVSVGKVISYIR